MTAEPVTPAPSAVEPRGAGASRPLEIAFAVTALTFAVVYLVLATQIELRQEAAAGQIDARFWPLVIGTSATAVAILLLLVAITRQPDSRDDIEPQQRGGPVRVLSTAILTVGYVAAWGVSSVVMLGYRIELFPVVTGVFLFVLMLVYGYRKVLGLILYPVLVTAFIYGVFGMLLRVPL